VTVRVVGVGGAVVGGAEVGGAELDGARVGVSADWVGAWVVGVETGDLGGCRDDADDVGDAVADADARGLAWPDADAEALPSGVAAGAALTDGPAGMAGPVAAASTPGTCVRNENSAARAAAVPPRVKTARRMAASRVGRSGWSEVE
jgi:hypothetical protein